MLDQSSPLTHSILQPEGKNAFALKRLRRALIDCELCPSESLSEADVSDRFGLGRAAVRHAFAKLEVEGFISPIPRNGWQVAPITGAAIGDVLEARCVVEPQLATGLVTQQDLRHLRIISSQLDALAGRTEAEAVVASRALDRSFLNLLSKRRGEIIAQWVNGALDHSARLLSYFEAGQPVYAPSSRTQLVDLLESGDEPAARSLLLQEVSRFREYIVGRMLRSRTFASSLTDVTGVATMGGELSIDHVTAPRRHAAPLTSKDKGTEQ
ncbi:DNA-binding GntR family transcriptional regulator [Rhizobium skierniewicense]|uniref:DNA-binding GntR family transcriptional regulator n=1 Tax=Rhizobium skierniewicense TaxID=984260 RepID=A0A7W6CBN0_9HYPH|nr:GntR family transcriptional regulator [Rhizobium skierniewicense]MBB3944266.1 DNA-binding GntR family transcriptional regulator [Rhizobium skierniewicense]